MEEIKMIICNICNLEKEFYRFQKNRKQCILCLSKRSNEKSKNKNYFKNYYVNHRDELLSYQANLYHTKYKKSLDSEIMA